MENKYFAELTRRLKAEGISTGEPDGGKCIPIDHIFALESPLFTLYIENKAN